MIRYTIAGGMEVFNIKRESSSNPRSHSLAAVFTTNLIQWPLLFSRTHPTYSTGTCSSRCPLLEKYVTSFWEPCIVRNDGHKLRLWFHSRGLGRSQGGMNSDDVTSICGDGSRMNYRSTFGFPQMWTGSKSQWLNCLRNDFDSPQWIRPRYALIKSFGDLFIGQFPRLHTSCQLVTQLISSDGSWSVQTHTHTRRRPLADSHLYVHCGYQAVITYSIFFVRD